MNRKPDYISPGSLAEALDVLGSSPGEARVIAGGTDLVPRMRAGVNAPRLLVDLRLLSLDLIKLDGDVVNIGACVTHTQIAESALIAENFSALKEAALNIAGPPIRNRGTIGGNLVNASPAADLVPPLLVYDAELVLVGATGERVVPVTEFFTGPGRTVLAEGEILREVRIPKPVKRTAADFMKVGKRKAMAISVVNLTTRLTLDEKGSISTARIALGSVAPTPIRAIKAEVLLEGAQPGPELFAQAGQLASEEISPISDIRASAEYRKKLTAVITRRSLAVAWSQLGGALP